MAAPDREATCLARERPRPPRRAGRRLLNQSRAILRSTTENYIASESLTRGAAIAFYSVTSLIPVLAIVIAIGSVVFGETAARGAIVSELGALVGSAGAQLIQIAIESASRSGS